MRCTKEKCLASVEWFGHSDDPALAKLATGYGWRVHEGEGWLCPHHATRSPAEGEDRR